MRTNPYLLYLSLSTLILAGCELKDAVKVGGECPGITYSNIIHLSDDACMLDQSCEAEDQDAIRMGFCPPNFRCVESNGELFCKHGCQSDQVMCNGECIDPKTSMTNCGANPNGECSDDRSFSNNYKGVNCKEASVTSGSRMICSDGRCIANNCGPDEHPVKDDSGATTCEPDSKDACGSVDVKCRKTEVCKAGVCTESCQGSQIACNGTCIDPNTSNEFCGAKTGCTGYDVCKNGKVCAGGSCRILDCASANEMKCHVGDSEQCIDIASDVMNCGNCDYKCEAHKPANSSVVACSNKQCIFACDSGYTDCGTDGIIECVDLNGTKAHCGSCDKACVGNQFCKNNKCAENDCNEFECPQADQCKKNDREACGPECTNCLTRHNASEATCDDSGICHVTKCANAYHLVSNNGSYTCEPNDKTSCGSADAANAVDCTKIPNASATSCEGNKCKVLSCSSGYHVVDNILCEADDDNNCGVHGNACHVDNGTSKCQNGSCVTTACHTGYHQYGNICTPDNINDCGGKNCETSVPGWLSGTCSDGECRVSNCAPNYHMTSSGCEANSTDNCLRTGAKCADANATENICDNEKGCQVTGCKTKYHVVTNPNGTSYCSPNMDTSCGRLLKNCTEDYADKGWLNGKCNVDTGMCYPVSCISNYTIVENKACLRTCYYTQKNSKGYCCPSQNEMTKCLNNNQCSSCTPVTVSGSSPPGNGDLTNCGGGFLTTQNPDKIYCYYGFCKGLSKDTDPLSFSSCFYRL